VVNATRASVLELPSSFSFTRRGFVDVDNVLKHFKPDSDLKSLTVDLTRCESANFQALTLLIQSVVLDLERLLRHIQVRTADSGPTKMLRKMEASTGVRFF